METNSIAIDPSRLASGQWCHRAHRTVGEGDIAASYSAERIGMGEPLRKPFEWKGALYVCVGVCRRKGAGLSAEAYRLVTPTVFAGEVTSYGQKTSDAEAARSDPNGFYHGMGVKQAGTEYVLCGPPITFVPGQTEQLSLF